MARRTQRPARQKKGLTRARDQLAAERFNGKRMIYGGFKVFVSA